MSLLLELSVRGSAAVAMLLLLERLGEGRIKSRSRRSWWWALPLAFLVPLHVPLLPALGHLASSAQGALTPLLAPPREAPASANPVPATGSLAFVLWLSGAIAYAAAVGLQTARARRRWSAERPTADPALLGLLRSCQTKAGVTTPVALVVSSSVGSPLFMGWMRPRILLPQSVVDGSSASELRPILLHELAHLRGRDIPFDWLLTLVRTVHWFNPLAHLGAIWWSRFREEAADEAAIQWMGDPTGAAYGQALLRCLRLRQAASAPFGAFAIAESVHQLRKRIHMINRYRNKSPRVIVTALGALSLAAVVCSISARAEDAASSDPTAASIAAGHRFFGEVDNRQWNAVWTDTTARLQKFEGTKGAFIALMEKSRRALFGRCLERKLTALVFKTDPEPAFKGDYAYLYFDASFENNPAPQREFAVFKRESDGTWKNDGWAFDDRDRMPVSKFLPK